MHEDELKTAAWYGAAWDGRHTLWGCRVANCGLHDQHGLIQAVLVAWK